MSKFTKHIWRALGRVFYPNFHNDAYMNSTLVRFIFWQKILRINGSVSWPVHYTSQIISPENIKNGTKAPGFAIGCYIDARNGIEIGENVYIGPKVSIISKNHDFENYTKYTDDNPVRIGKNCWLATGCIILSGVSLAEHTIVGAGAVVTHSFTETNIVIAGNPAKIVKTIRDYNENAR